MGSHKQKRAKNQGQTSLLQRACDAPRVQKEPFTTDVFVKTSLGAILYDSRVLCAPARVWYTVFALEKAYAHEINVHISCTQLSVLLDISQSTAHRALMSAIENGWITAELAPTKDHYMLLDIKDPFESYAHPFRIVSAKQIWYINGRCLEALQLTQPKLKLHNLSAKTCEGLVEVAAQSLDLKTKAFWTSNQARRVTRTLNEREEKARERMARAFVAEEGTYSVPLNQTDVPFDSLTHSERQAVWEKEFASARDQMPEILANVANGTPLNLRFFDKDKAAAALAKQKIEKGERGPVSLSPLAARLHREAVFNEALKLKPPLSVVPPLEPLPSKEGTTVARNDFGLAPKISKTTLRKRKELRMARFPQVSETPASAQEIDELMVETEGVLAPESATEPSKKEAENDLVFCERMPINPRDGFADKISTLSHKWDVKEDLSFSIEKEIGSNFSINAQSGGRSDEVASPSEAPEGTGSGIGGGRKPGSENPAEPVRPVEAGAEKGKSPQPPFAINKSKVKVTFVRTWDPRDPEEYQHEDPNEGPKAYFKKHGHDHADLTPRDVVLVPTPDEDASQRSEREAGLLNPFGAELPFLEVFDPVDVLSDFGAYFSYPPGPSGYLCAQQHDRHRRAENVFEKCAEADKERVGRIFSNRRVFERSLANAFTGQLWRYDPALVENQKRPFLRISKHFGVFLHPSQVPEPFDKHVLSSVDHWAMAQEFYDQIFMPGVRKKDVNESPEKMRDGDFFAKVISRGFWWEFCLAVMGRVPSESEEFLTHVEANWPVEIPAMDRPLLLADPEDVGVFLHSVLPKATLLRSALLPVFLQNHLEASNPQPGKRSGVQIKQPKVVAKRTDTGVARQIFEAEMRLREQFNFDKNIRYHPSIERTHPSIAGNFSSVEEAIAAMATMFTQWARVKERAFPYSEPCFLALKSTALRQMIAQVQRSLARDEEKARVLADSKGRQASDKAFEANKTAVAASVEEKRSTAHETKEPPALAQPVKGMSADVSKMLQRKSKALVFESDKYPWEMVTGDGKKPDQVKLKTYCFGLMRTSLVNEYISDLQRRGLSQQSAGEKAHEEFNTFGDITKPLINVWPLFKAEFISQLFFEEARHLCWMPQDERALIASEASGAEVKVECN